MHAAQHIDGIKHALRGRCRAQLEHVQELRRVAAQRGVALADSVQKVEVLGLRELLRLAHAGGEGIPGDHRFDGGERIAAALLGFQQGLTDAAIQAHLVVDGLARRLELLLMLVLGGIEQLAEDAVVQVDDLVGDGGHAFNGQRHQGRITPLRLELGQVGGCHLPALACDLEQAVLMHLPLDARRQVKCLQGFEALNVFEHVPRVRLGGRLTQPGQPRRLAAFLALEQFVQALVVERQQCLGQCRIDAPVGACDGLGAGALDGVHGGQDDRLPPQAFDKRAGQHDAFVGLQGQLGQRMHRLPVVAHGEGLEPEHRLQLDQVLTPRLLALAVLVPAVPPAP